MEYSRQNLKLTVNEYVKSERNSRIRPWKWSWIDTIH